MASLCGVQVWLIVALFHLISFPRDSLQTSGPGFTFETDEYFYKVVYEMDDIRTFYEAEEICSEFENGHLASITSPAENEWLHRKIQSLGHLSRPGRFWVGASDKRRFGSFEWLDGKPFVFHAAHYLGARNSRKKQDYEMCLSLTSSKKDVFWTEDDCYNARGYICKTEGVPKRLASRRRFGYEFEDNIWTYKFIINRDDTLSWPEADVYCRKTEWGQLLSISDEQDSNRVSQWLQLLRHVFGFSKLWIGASDIAREGKFSWTDGSVFNYTNWAPGEPSAVFRGREQDCTAISPFWGQWSDEYCLHKLPFICKIKMCGERTDLAFAIDASGSMGDKGFSKAKRFVKALTASFKVSSRGTHVGVIRFSTRARLMFDFNSYYSHDEVNDAIDDIEYIEGGTRTELALRLARTHLFSEVGGYRAREDVFKIFILMTDGRSESTAKVAREAKLLKRRGVHVLAVGIGESTNQKELETIATSKSDVIGVVSFRELMIRMNEIKDKLCDIAIENDRRVREKNRRKATKRSRRPTRPRRGRRS